MTELAVAAPALSADEKAGAKSAVQKRFDCLTREKYQAQRERAAAEAAVAEQRAQNATLRGEIAELQAALRRALGLVDEWKNRAMKKEIHAR